MRRELRDLGVDCGLIAASSIARSDSDKKRKNDRRDAWARRIERCLVVDMAVKEWCELSKVAESSPHKWVPRFRGEDSDRNVGPLSREPIPACRKGPSNVA